MDWISQVVRNDGDHVVPRACRRLGVCLASLGKLEEIGFSKCETRQLAENRASFHLVIAELCAAGATNEEEGSAGLLSKQRHDERWTAAAPCGQHPWNKP